MTTIILTIVGILLAAAAALMAFWYGGDAFEHGQAEAVASTQVSHMSQLAAAVRFYEIQEQRDDLPQSDGSFVARLKDAGYLSGDVVDASGKGVVYWYSPTTQGRRHILIGWQSADVCTRINRKVGVATTPKSVEFEKIVGEMGCVDLGGGNNVAYFRV